MADNQRIAEIDGWYTMAPNSNLSPTFYRKKDSLVKINDLPNYENNTGELIRVCLENGFYFEISGDKGDMVTITVSKGEAKESIRFVYEATVAKINAALVAAIIEAADVKC